MAKENDLYYGDLVLLKRRVTEWQNAHPKGKIAKPLKAFVVIAGFAIIIGAYFIDPEAAQAGGVSVFTMTMLAVFILMIIFARKMSAILQPPFAKLYNARFEASDDGIICFFQQKMAEYQYYIKDKNIKEWIIDDDVHCMYIKGDADFSQTTKEGSERLGTVEAFYMLIPFDEYDLDDLIAPYGDLVQFKNGTLRQQFAGEHIDIPIIAKSNPYAKEKAKKKELKK